MVLAVYAHPDDADVACGGALARWAKAGSSVHLIVCTDGGKGTADASVKPKKLVVLKGRGHYEVYAGEAFREVIEPTLAWYRHHLPA